MAAAASAAGVAAAAIVSRPGSTPTRRSPPTIHLRPLSKAASPTRLQQPLLATVRSTNSRPSRKAMRLADANVEGERNGRRKRRSRRGGRRGERDDHTAQPGFRSPYGSWVRSPDSSEPEFDARPEPVDLSGYAPAASDAPAEGSPAAEASMEAVMAAEPKPEVVAAPAVETPRAEYVAPEPAKPAPVVVQEAPRAPEPPRPMSPRCRRRLRRRRRRAAGGSARSRRSPAAKTANSGNDRGAFGRLFSFRRQHPRGCEAPSPPAGRQTGAAPPSGRNRLSRAQTERRPARSRWRSCSQDRCGRRSPVRRHGRSPQRQAPRRPEGRRRTAR